MAVFKCKMCGGALEITPGSSVAVCTFCGTKQTLPKLDDEQRANLYDRANHFRRNNDYDKAMALYEQLLAADKTDAEAYWSILLCKYGVEYVEDPATHKMVPTINRAQYTSIFADEDYKAAIQYADGYQRDVYEQEAKTIDAIQREIIAVSQKEEPFDVFISYKETDASGRRTLDSVLAQDIYYQLTKEGYKVFFSRITLESKLGTAYEPYIFAALNTAKVMIVVGTRQEYFNAVWVRNEWSRFLGLIKNGKSKILIPAFRDMDPYDLPEEFSHLQALDMSKLGFVQDLIHGIEKIVKKSAPVVEPTIVVGASANTDALVKRAYMSIEDRDYDKADSFAEQILNINPELADAYIIKLLIECKARSIEELRHRTVDISKSPNYRRALKYANDELKKKLEEIQKANADYIASQPIYDKAKKAIDAKNWGEAVELLTSIAQYKDSAALIEQCKIENERNLYEIAKVAMLARDWQTAITFLSHIPEYKDSIVLIEQCKEQAELARKETIYAKALKVVSSSFANENALRQCISDLRSLDGYKDSNEQIYKLEQRIEELTEQQRIAAERAAKAQHAKKIAGLVVAIVLVLTIIIAVLTVKVFIPHAQYNTANKLAEEGRLNEASALYKELGEYKSSQSLFFVVDNAQKADAYLSAGSLNDAITCLSDNSCEIIITLNAGDGKLSNNSSTDTVAYNNTIFEETTPSRDGYTFVEWELKEHSVTCNQMVINATLSFEAVWEPLEYSISYDLDGGVNDELNPSRYTIQDAITISAPSRKGYTFIGWITKEDSVPRKIITLPQNSMGNRSYKAVWEANKYTVSYDANGGEVDIDLQIVTFNANVNHPTPTTKAAGYLFDGWYSASTLYKDGTWATANDVTLKAKWIPNSSTAYTVNCYLENSDNDKYTLERRVLYGTTDTIPAVPQIAHFISPKRQSIAINGDGSTVIDYYYRRETLAVQLYYNNGSALQTTTFKYGQHINNIPTRSGYTFGGWFSDADLSSPINLNAVTSTVLFARWAEESLPADFTFNLDTNTCESYHGNSSNVVVPSYYKNVLITKIGKAFINCNKLTSVTIPNSVITIEAGAFAGCSSLTSMTLPFVGGSKTATSASASTLFGYIFGEYSYSGSTATKQYYGIKIDSSLTNSSFVTYYIPSSLQSVTVTGGRLLYGAFYKCIGLTAVTIGYGVDSIGGRYAFFGCSKLTSINLPNSMKSIGYSAFEDCTALESITIPNSVTSIGSFAFSSCTALKSVSIGTSVTSIGEYAFSGCDKLASVIIPDSVTSIENGVFYQCGALNSVTFGSGVTSLYAKVFRDCNALISINYHGTKAQWSAISKSSGWNTNTGNYTIHCADGDIKKS